MKQYTFAFSTANELNKWLVNLPKQKYKDILGTLYIPYNFHTFDWAIKILKKHNIKVIGCTTQISIIDNTLNDLRIILCLQYFNDTIIHITKDIKQVEQFCNEKAIKGIQLLSINCNSFIENYINEIYPKLNDVFMFGGLVGNNSNNDYIIFNDIIMNKGIVFVLYESLSLNFIYRIGSGWRALGPKLEITKVSNQTIINELNYKPAIQLYEKYLNIKNDEYFLKNTTIFPIEIIRNGEKVLRQPYSCKKDGSLQFVAGFKLGEFIQLAYGDLNYIIKESQNNQRELSSLNLDGLLYFSCYDRFITLGNDLSMELNIDSNLISSAGFYSFGEIIKTKYAPVIQNKAQLIIGIKEGEIKEKYHYLPKQQTNKFSEQNEPMSRMMYFINAVTNDMNKKHQELSYLARIDRLTELLNRGETENLLNNSIQYANNTTQPLSILMIDIDNFKDINDTYGHDKGDEVLKAIALTIKNNIRSLDFAGRWGGDEFFVILPNILERQSANIAKRIKKQLYKINITKERITASIGIASLSKNETLKTFTKRVDVALYQAKKKYKKNCIVLIDNNRNFKLVRGEK